MSDVAQIGKLVGRLADPEPAAMEGNAGTY